MFKGGVIMDVVDVAQARIAEEAGAVAVMALGACRGPAAFQFSAAVAALPASDAIAAPRSERVPADIRRDGGVARMSDPRMIKEIMEAVTIPVMAKCRIGHFVEAQILESVGADYIDESEVAIAP